MLNVCVCVCCLVNSANSRDLLYVKCLCVLSRYLSLVVEICYMLNVCVCVFSLSQPSSIDLSHVKCVCVVSLSQPGSTNLLYVKGVCVLSGYLRSVVEICCMLNVCVCCLVISAQ